MKAYLSQPLGNSRVGNGKSLPSSLTTLGQFWIIVISLTIGLSYGLVKSVPESLAADWQTIQKRGRLVVGIKSNLPPLSSKNSTGDLEGLEIDIARELAKELLGSETAIELVPVSNRDRLSALAQDRVDLVVAQLTVTQNRARLVDFTLPYYKDGTGLIAKQGTTLSQLQQAKIAVLKGSDTIATLQYFLPKATLVGVDSYSEGLAALQAGQVDAFAGDGIATLTWRREHPEFAQVGGKISSKNLAIALPRGLQYEELRRQVSTTVEKWRKNGWLQQRLKFWGLEE